jgi:predicted nucleic acid-binding protein
MNPRADIAWLYVDSSAVLEWLLAQPGADRVHAQLAGARRLVASQLTILECARALARTAGRQQSSAQATLRTLMATLNLVPVELDLMESLSRPFAVEPVRTLDAIHLSTAVALRIPGERVGFLALDVRLRVNAEALGFEVLP